MRKLLEQHTLDADDGSGSYFALSPA